MLLRLHLFCFSVISVINDVGQWYETFPITADYPIYIFDPTASSTEYVRIMMIFQALGLWDNHLIEIDVSVFKVFPNLQKLDLVGLKESDG